MIYRSIQVVINRLRFDLKNWVAVFVYEMMMLVIITLFCLFHCYSKCGYFLSLLAMSIVYVIMLLFRGLFKFAYELTKISTEYPKVYEVSSVRRPPRHYAKRIARTFQPLKVSIRIHDISSYTFLYYFHFMIQRVIDLLISSR